jgi:cyanate permease
MAAGVVAAAQIGKGAAALPVLQSDFGLSPTAGAWWLSIMSAIGAVAGAALGWAGQGLGYRREVQLGLTAIVLANAAGAAVDSTGWLLAARVGEGLGFVLVILGAPGLLTEVSAPEHRRLVLGAWGAYMPVGSGLAALLVPLAISAVGWRGTWLIDAGLAAVALLAVSRWVPAGPARRRPSGEALLQAVRSPGVVCVAVLFVLYAGQYLTVLGLLPSLVVSGTGASLTTAGVLSGVAFLVNAPGNLLGAFLQQRLVARWALVVAGGVCMAITVWGVHDPALPLAARVGSVLAFSFTAGVVPSAFFSGLAAMTSGTTAVGAAVGLQTQGSGLGQLLVPPLVVAAGTAVPSWTTRPLVLSCLAALLVIGGVLYGRLERPVAVATAAPARRRSATAVDAEPLTGPAS